jgi:hypothetical protein
VRQPHSITANEFARRVTRQLQWHDLIRLKTPHAQQARFINSPAKRKVIRAGRRGGKTTGVGIQAVEAFKAGQRVLYAAPTQEQIDRFWVEIKLAFAEPVERGILYKNETRHILELPGTEQRIRAKTAWDADSLRGDYADVLILDEYQFMNEDTWGRVGAPMLLDNDGDAVFIYTPPSLHSRSRTKANDPRHAAKLFKRAQSDQTGRWAAFHFTSHDNPHISEAALAEITVDMTEFAYEQEIMADDKDEAPGALWTRERIERLRTREIPEMRRIVVAVDPPGGATECGIVVVGLGVNDEGYVLEDCSLRDSPGEWAKAVVQAYDRWEADRVIAEINYGGDMVEHTVKTVDKTVSFKTVRASRGKQVRAEPVAAIYEKAHAHHLGSFPHLEEELCNWQPNRGLPSPNRLDALVWGLTELMLGGAGELREDAAPDYLTSYRG